MIAEEAVDGIDLGTERGAEAVGTHAAVMISDITLRPLLEEIPQGGGLPRVFFERLFCALTGYMAGRIGRDQAVEVLGAVRQTLGDVIAKDRPHGLH